MVSGLGEIDTFLRAAGASAPRGGEDLIVETFSLIASEFEILDDIDGDNRAIRFWMFYETGAEFM